MCWENPDAGIVPWGSEKCGMPQEKARVVYVSFIISRRG
jgi:hypothetical protein